jgi:hypothetical protein
MADLTITAANVVPESNAVLMQGTAGATITAGQALYIDATTNTLKLAQADGTAAEAAAVGIAVNGASSGQPVIYQTGGDLALGTGTNAVVYVVSATAGGIAPNADITTTGHRKTILATGIGSNKVKVHPINTTGVVP